MTGAERRLSLSACGVAAARQLDMFARRPRADRAQTLTNTPLAAGQHTPSILRVYTQDTRQREVHRGQVARNRGPATWFPSFVRPVATRSARQQQADSRLDGPVIVRVTRTWRVHRVRQSVARTHTCRAINEICTRIVCMYARVRVCASVGRQKCKTCLAFVLAR